MYVRAPLMCGARSERIEPDRANGNIGINIQACSAADHSIERRSWSYLVRKKKTHNFTAAPFCEEKFELEMSELLISWQHPSLARMATHTHTHTVS